MATWSEFANAAPEMAERGAVMLAIPLAYLATMRKSGAPRLHPLSPILADGRLFVAIQSTSPRRFDLARDGRYSLHTLPPELGPNYDEFEFNLTGTAKSYEDVLRYTTNLREAGVFDDVRVVRIARPNTPDADVAFQIKITAEPVLQDEETGKNARGRK